MFKHDMFWRIAVSEAELDTVGYFFIRRIPPPIHFQYLDYSLKIDASDGRQGKQGFNRGSMQFQEIAIADAHTLIAVMKAANDKPYLTVDLQDADTTNHWVDIQAWVKYPDISTLPLSRAKVIRNLIFEFNNIIIINDPTTIIDLI